jgi:bis(5'-nucleosidyl)-tetraphosphatase
MITEESSGAIVFRKNEGVIYYLLLQYEKNYWGLPKGRIEKGEEVEETAKREILEETGINDIEFIKDFKETISYFFTREKIKIFKINVYFLAETKTKEIKLSWEHIDFKWLPYSEALEKLTFKNSKDVLIKANNFLSEIRA